MLFIQENNTNSAWKSALKKLYEYGYNPQDIRHFKMETMVIEMDSPQFMNQIYYFQFLKMI